MKSRTQIRVLAVVLALCLASPGFSIRPQKGNPAPLLQGQTATLLPNGSWLLVGGEDGNGHPLGTVALRDAQGVEQKLPLSLQFPRIWHTATVLPNGTVLILGGTGADGQIVQQVELFDPVSQTLQLPGPGAPAARAFHSATVLTDGRVLIAGGIGTNSEPLLNSELWDLQQQVISATAGPLSVGRRKHVATLLPDGRVLLSGGTDSSGNPLASAEVYDPQSQTFSLVANSQTLLAPSQGIAETTATSPEDGATDVSVTALISMRFSRPLQIQTINSQTILLEGPDGIVAANIVGAEHGMLAFITPSAALLPGTSYSVTFSGAVDTNSTNAGFMQFGFTTAGEPPTSAAWSPGTLWMNNNSTSRWQSLPPLQAEPGVTALAGQVLKLDGAPLKHVTLMIGNRRAFSNGTGRFLLAEIPSGHSAMMILADTANTPGRTYGIYKVGVDIKANQTNVLPYTIWMTPLDTAHAVKIPSPTTTETVVKSPLLPGLELHIPANTVITDYYGKPVTQVTVTPIPLNQPPFPLPNVQVPLYFTIQPGSAYIKVMSSSGPKGARLFYPNAYNYPAGAVYNFWNYDPGQKGWYIYGQGQVSADRSQIIPDPGVVIYEFTGAMVGSPNGAPAGGPSAGSHEHDGEPVDLSTGLFIYNKTDLVLPDVIPLSFTRTYRTNDNLSRPFGIGTTDNYEMFLVGDSTQYTYQELILPDGSRIRFPRTSPGTGYLDAIYTHTATHTRFYGATIQWDTNRTWLLTLRDGTVYIFPAAPGATNPALQALIGITDRYGNMVKITRDGNGNVTQVMSPNGRQIMFQHDPTERITSATDNMGRTVAYTYDSGGRLVTVTDANGGVTSYTYNSLNQLLTIKDPRNIVYITNQYDSNGRVLQQTLADGSTYQFAWTASTSWIQQWVWFVPVGFCLNCGGPAAGFYAGPGEAFHYCTNCYEGYAALVNQVSVTDPRGYVRTVVFNAQGYPQTDTRAVGRPEQQTLTYAYYADNLLQSVTDTLGRTTAFDYDANGDLALITSLAGTSQAVSTILQYTNPYDQIANITDPLNNTTSFSYDSLGSLVSITDPLQHQTVFANASGRQVAITDPVGNTTQFAYDGPNLAETTDPLGNSTSRLFDGAGRVTSSTDPLGRRTLYQYTPLNQPSQITNPLQGVTSFTYDGNGNLLTVTDALNHTTTWTYDSMDRVATRTDPLLRQSSFSYDGNGNLTSVTDRNGQVTVFQYDGLNRRIFAGFGAQATGGNTTYQSTINYTYDPSNRLTQVVDSVAGTITRSYDGLDRLISETTPQGSISYSYDNGGRRTSMQVAGQPAVSYTWDNANRLTQISQGASSVSFGYDNDNRRTSLSLSNNLAVSYAYDNDSHLTGLTYQAGTNVLGNLSYTYDAMGRRTQVSGSFANTGLPQPIGSATYDAANELTNWNGTNLSYDANGNMLSDGVNAFSWNARNQLATVNNVSLQYDAFGRRTQNAAGTSFLYDGANIVQELSGTTATANELNGGTDEVFTRTDSIGSFTSLKDALGSAIALVDSNGNLQTSYTYDPFGNTTTTGPTSANVFQYTGRENEGNGLYYYRARYYSPQLQRFISQDPIGLRGGINLYAYAGNNPTTLRDPSGKNPAIAVAGCVIGAGAGALAYYETAGRKATWPGYAASAIAGCLLSPFIPDFLDILLGIGPEIEAAEAAEAEAFGSEAVTEELQNIVNQAADRFAERGFTEAQQLAIDANPDLAPAFTGERIDYYASEIANEIGLPDGVQMTPRGSFGPDFFNPATGEWWDITTADQWASHVAKYGSGGTILIY